MELQGNIISGNVSGFGKITTTGNVIEKIDFSGNIHTVADWIIPGFIDTHIHGLGDGEAIGEGIRKMAEFAPSVGMTGIVPTLTTSPAELEIQYLETIRQNISENTGARILGSHLEGPFLDVVHSGGMNRRQLRNPDPAEAEAWIEAARGTLKIVTVAPELPGAGKVIKLLKDNNICVSLGHTGLSAESLPDAIDCGVSRVCHLFDAYSGRDVDEGVSQTALTDAVLIDDRLTIELICDGFHVPVGLVRLAVRAAGVNRIVAISDAMCGTGKPDGIYAELDGRLYKLENAGVCRLLDPPYKITGSCLTMNRAFSNLVHKFGFSPIEASLMTSANPASSIGSGDKYGTLAAGYTADMVILKSDLMTVKDTFIDGKSVLN